MKKRLASGGWIILDKIMELKNMLESIDKTKFLISELTKIQALYYDTLRDEVGVMDESEDWLFDYIYNVEEGSFEDFLKRYNLKVGDVIRE